MVVTCHARIVVTGMCEMSSGECQHGAQQHGIAGGLQWHHGLEVVFAVVNIILCIYPSAIDGAKPRMEMECPTHFPKCVI